MIYYIGHSLNKDIRWKSSSGGVGTQIIQYLLESGEFGTSMTFVFNRDKCQYEPKLIYVFSEYNNCGSIYQDTDNVKFIKDNISKIRNGIVVTCMPCQVNAIKTILSRHNIKSFIISLCCSGQTTIEGTWLYYKMLGLKKDDVVYMQYRGGGWPSGIQIKLKNGDVIRRKNNTYPWKQIHKSLLYRPKRCLYCTKKTNNLSDISLADPWLKEYIDNDQIGNSIIICNNNGEKVVNAVSEAKEICVKQISIDIYIQSQLGTIAKKEKSNTHKVFNKVVSKMGRDGSVYKRIIISSAFLLKIHLKILSLMSKILN